MNPKELKRAYNGSDAFMVQEARLIHGLVNADLARFTSFDSTITAAAQTAYLAAITAAETVVDDSAIVGQLKQSTEVMLVSMENAKTKYSEVKYYVLKTFPNSPGTQHEFGLNGYADVRTSVPKMINFLDELSKAAIKYQTQLVAAGYSATAIAAIATLRADLVAKNLVQKLIKKQRPKLTEDRIAVLNTCYARMATLNAAGQLVYANDYAKQKQFVYMPGSENGSGIQTFEGSVAAGHTATIAEIDYDEDNVFTFTNTGSVSLSFCLSSSGNIEGIITSIPAGANQTLTGSELNENGTILLVQNTAAEVGNYTVEVEV